MNIGETNVPHTNAYAFIQTFIRLQSLFGSCMLWCGINAHNFFSPFKTNPKQPINHKVESFVFRLDGLDSLLKIKL